jgi:hypothetical protein
VRLCKLGVRSNRLFVLLGDVPIRRYDPRYVRQQVAAYVMLILTATLRSCFRSSAR